MNKVLFAFLTCAVGSSVAYAGKSGCKTSITTQGIYFFEYVDRNMTEITVETSDLAECNREMENVAQKKFPYYYMSCSPVVSLPGTAVTLLSAGFFPNTMRYDLNRIEINVLGEASATKVDDFDYLSTGTNAMKDLLQACEKEKMQRLSEWQAATK
jgi:hypothetical protein